jgi:hypothetical protein
MSLPDPVTSAREEMRENAECSKADLNREVR